MPELADRVAGGEDDEEVIFECESEGHDIDEDDDDDDDSSDDVIVTGMTEAPPRPRRVQRGAGVEARQRVSQLLARDREVAQQLQREDRAVARAEAEATSEGMLGRRFRGLDDLMSVVSGYEVDVEDGELELEVCAGVKGVRCNVVVSAVWFAGPAPGLGDLGDVNVRYTHTGSGATSKGGFLPEQLLQGRPPQGTEEVRLRPAGGEAGRVR